MKLDNKNILCTVSAGYSSILMALLVRKLYPDHDILYVMANTSRERDESLDFMNECDKHYKLNLIWLQAVINQEKGKGTEFRITEYENLKRNGEIFESGIQKYGIPCKFNKWCNRELKLVPIKKFADSIFGANNYSIAIGIRADEMDRVSSSVKTNNIFYPLIDQGIDTRFRNRFWSMQPIQIKIPAFKGNCDMCFEKSIRKLMTVAKEDCNLTEWWGEMESKYSSVTYEGKEEYNKYIEKYGRVPFFRDNRTIKDIKEMTLRPFTKATDEYVYENTLFDAEGECGGGCTVFT